MPKQKSNPGSIQTMPKSSKLSEDFVVDTDSEPELPQALPTTTLKKSKPVKDGKQKAKSETMDVAVSKKSATLSQADGRGKAKEKASKSSAKPKDSKHLSAAESAAKSAKAVKSQPAAPGVKMDLDSESSGSESVSSSASDQSTGKRKPKVANTVNGAKAQDQSKASSSEGRSVSNKANKANRTESSSDSGSDSATSKELPKSRNNNNSKSKQTSTDITMVDAEAASDSTGSTSSDERDQSTDSDDEDTPQSIGAFRPPGGFRRPKGLETSTSALKLLRKAHEKGRQLWHIVAPADLPTDAIQSALLRTTVKDEKEKKVLDSEKVVATHAGVDYRLVEGTADRISRRIYIPQGDDAQFAPTKAKVARVLHIRQKFELPDAVVGEENGKESQPIAAAAKPRVQQPPGLRVRYQPYGVENKDTVLAYGIARPVAPLSSTSETPSKADDKAASPSKKRKVANADGNITTPKKDGDRKKRRKEAAEHNASLPNGDLVLNGSISTSAITNRTAETDSTAEKQRRKAEKKARKAQELAGGEEANGVKNTGVAELPDQGANAEAETAEETPEERALRKAERKRRKEEKKAGRARA